MFFFHFVNFELGNLNNNQLSRQKISEKLLTQIISFWQINWLRYINISKINCYYNHSAFLQNYCNQVIVVWVFLNIFSFKHKRFHAFIFTTTSITTALVPYALHCLTFNNPQINQVHLLGLHFTSYFEKFATKFSTLNLVTFWGSSLEVRFGLEMYTFPFLNI